MVSTEILCFLVKLIRQTWIKKNDSKYMRNRELLIQ